MTMREAEALIEQSNRAYKDNWERTRFIGYVTALSNGAKLKKPSDLVTFSWEKQSRAKTGKPSKDKLEQMTKEMTESLQRYNDGLTEPVKL